MVTDENIKTQNSTIELVNIQKTEYVVKKVNDSSENKYKSLSQ